MRGTVYTDPPVTSDTVEEVLNQLTGEHFTWGDIQNPAPGALTTPQVAAALGFDRERLRTVARFDGPARLEVRPGSAYATFPVLVESGVAHIHAIATPGLLLSVHDVDLAITLDEVAASPGMRAAAHGSTALFVLAEAALRTLRQALTDLRDELDDLDDDILRRPRPQQLMRLADVRGGLAAVRRALRPQSTLLDDVAAQLPTRHDLNDDVVALIRAHATDVDSVDHMAESLLDAAGHTMQTYTSLVATRQGQVINFLTIISLLFLPLTFLTGFFGMNSAYLSRNTTSAGAFWLLGVGLLLAVLAAVVVVIVRRGWLSMFRPDQPDTDSRPPTRGPTS